MKQGKYLDQPGQKEKKKVSPMKITAIVLSTLAALLVLAAVGIGIFIWYSGSLRSSMFSSRGSVSDAVPQPTAKQEEAIDADWIDNDGDAYNYRDDVISILIMGIDYMKDENNWEADTVSNGGNADMLGLVILDTKTFDFSILYIPRDTWTDVIAMDAEGNYIDTVRTNISAAHSYGDGDALSCQLTEDAVSRLLMGVPVNRYAALDYNAIYTLNEMVGGIRITFDSDCTDVNSSFTAGSTATLNNLYLSMLVTYRDCNELDGAYTRGMRIMNVLKALFNQCKGKIMEDPTVALDMVNGLAGYITTDLDLSEIAYLARNIGKMEFDSDTVVSLRGETEQGEQYAEFHADEDWIHDFVVEKFCVPVK